MSNSLRVLMVTSAWPAPGTSPTTHFIKRQATFLKAAGLDVDVFHFIASKNPRNYLRAWVHLRRKLRVETYDVMHAQFGNSALLAFPKTLPLVVTYRGSDILGIVSDADGRHTRMGNFMQGISRRVARRADGVIVVSEHMKAHLDPGTEAHVIPSGIDLRLFRPLPQDEARKRLNVSPDERLILFVGNPAQKRKRCALAKRAVEILNETTPARLWVAWKVNHQDVPIYMNAADALLFTSMQEGSPNVVKEALACNLPVVSVPVGDTEERLRGLETCELVREETPEALAAALRRVLDRNQRADTRQTVAHLDETRLTQQVIQIYENAITRYSLSGHRFARRADQWHG